MIDSNNINVMREKLRKIGKGSGDVQEEIERIDNLIGASPIPGSQRTITGSLNYLYDNSVVIKTHEYTGTGSERFIELPEKPAVVFGIYNRHVTSEVRTSLKSFIWGEDTVINTYDGSGGDKPQVWSIEYDGDTKFKIKGVNQVASQNTLGEEYIVYYI